MAEPGRRRAASERRTAVLLALAGAGLIVLSASRTWASVQFSGSNLNELLGPTVSGRDRVPAAIPIALAAAAGAIVLATTGRLIRAVVAVGLTIGGVVVAAAGVRAQHDPDGAAARAVRDSLGVFSTDGDLPSILGQFTVTLTLWPWLAVAGGVLITVAGLLTLGRGWTWPGPASRFERAGGRAGTGAITAQPMVPAAPPDYGTAGAWDALSRGEDPTFTDGDQT